MIQKITTEGHNEKLHLIPSRISNECERDKWKMHDVWGKRRIQSNKKASLMISTRRWQVNIQMNLGEIEYECMEWIELSLDMVKWKDFVSTMMNTRIP
jgi:hypothetical protein